MKHLLRSCLSGALLISSAVITAGNTPVVSLLKIRPQSLDNASKVAGEAGLTNVYNRDDWYANFDVTFKYQRSFRSKDIAHCLFGDDLVRTTTTTTAFNSCDNECGDTSESRSLLIQGSAVSGRSTNALLADYFYLPETFNGLLSFKPVISSFVLNLNFYTGLDEWVSGMFFRVYAPFVHTKWDLNMSETIISGSTGTVSDLRFSPATVPNANLLHSASAYFAGETPPSLTQSTGGTAPATVTIARDPLQFNKMLGNVSTNTVINNSCCDSDCDNGCGSSRTRNGFGEIRAELGWNFWQNEDYHVGMYLAGAAPTGNRAHAEFLFDPYVGNLRHWEVGGGLTAHYTFWRSENEERHVGIYLDGTITHLFKAKEQRVFDLQGKPLSRYALAARVNTPATNGLAGTTPAFTTVFPGFQFSNEFTPVANLTAQDVNVSVGAQVDLALWVNFTAGAFSWDLGYDFWMQTCEKFGCNNCGPRLRTETDTWVLVGDALVYGIGSDDSIAYPLSMSESKATINSGTNLGTTPTSAINGNIDNPLFAENDANFSLNNNAGNPLEISIPIVYLSEANISTQQKNKPITNKIWTHLNYTWDREGVVPYFGLGGAAEFGSSHGEDDDCNPNPTPSTSCDTDCIKCSVSQWQIWAKVGISFD